MYFSRSSLLATLSCLATVDAQSLSDALGMHSDLSTFAGLVEKLGLASSLNNSAGYTILAPINSAFANVSSGATASTKVNGAPLSDLFQYHIIDGLKLMSTDIGSGAGNITPTLLTSTSYDGLTSAAQVVNPVRNGSVVEIYSNAKNASRVMTADITFSNGVIHAIESILTIPANATAVAKQNSSLSLSTFSSAVGRANISSLVDTMHNLTIFAPTTAGFSFDDLAESEADPTTLKNIMSYHVISNGSVLYANDLMALPNNTNITTIEGRPLLIHFNGTHIQVDNATVTTSNVLIKNGVIHVINQLLDPASQKGYKGGFKPSAAPSLEMPTYVVGLAIAVAAMLLL